MIEIDFVRVSTMTGVQSNKTFMVDADKLRAYCRGEIYIQDAFPHLSADDREYIISGCTPEEFARLTEEFESSTPNG